MFIKITNERDNDPAERFYLTRCSLCELDVMEQNDISEKETLNANIKRMSLIILL